jgi:hypothetical protein
MIIAILAFVFPYVAIHVAAKKAVDTYEGYGQMYEYPTPR